jgi:hypothetical protein
MTRLDIFKLDLVASIMGAVLSVGPLPASELAITSVQSNGNLTWTNVFGLNDKTNIIDTAGYFPHYDQVGWYAVEWSPSVTNE